MASPDTNSRILVDPEKVREAFEYVKATPFDTFRAEELAAIGVDNPLLEQDVMAMFSGVIHMGRDAAYRMMTGQLAAHHLLKACTEGPMPKITDDQIRDLGDAVTQFPHSPKWLSDEDRELIEPAISQIFRARFNVSPTLTELSSGLSHRQSREGMHWMLMLFKPYIVEL